MIYRLACHTKVSSFFFPPTFAGCFYYFFLCFTFILFFFYFSTFFLFLFSFEVVGKWNAYYFNLHLILCSRFIFPIITWPLSINKKQTEYDLYTSIRRVWWVYYVICDYWEVENNYWKCFKPKEIQINFLFHLFQGEKGITIWSVIGIIASN